MASNETQVSGVLRSTAALAHKLLCSLVGAVLTKTWMPGACHGATAGSLLGEHKAEP